MDVFINVLEGKKVKISNSTTVRLDADVVDIMSIRLGIKMEEN